MENKSNNPKSTQKQIAQHLGYSDSTNKQQRARRNIPSPYKRKNSKNVNMSSQVGLTDSSMVRGGVNGGNSDKETSF